jgi:hypothetical protein
MQFFSLTFGVVVNHYPTLLSDFFSESTAVSKSHSKTKAGAQRRGLGDFPPPDGEKSITPLPHNLSPLTEKPTTALRWLYSL